MVVVVVWWSGGGGGIVWLLLFVCSESLEELYAFHYTANDITQRHVGWNFYDLQSEYLRMGVPNDNWVLSHINKDYEVSTYGCSQ